MFGKLKVVDPSPVPYVVPIAENSAEYVVLLTAEPSHNNHPAGKISATYIIMVPEDNPELTTEMYAFDDNSSLVDAPEYIPVSLGIVSP
jgi:hypothetical protein